MTALLLRSEKKIFVVKSPDLMFCRSTPLLPLLVTVMHHFSLKYVLISTACSQKCVLFCITRNYR